VAELAALAFSYVGLDYRDYVTIDEKLFRPAEVEILQGDASVAKHRLGWDYRLSFEDLVHEMVDEDLRINSVFLPKASSDRTLSG
jgi:GDPmannose 4,6-dehydratase